MGAISGANGNKKVNQIKKNTNNNIQKVVIFSTQFCKNTLF